MKEKKLKFVTTHVDNFETILVSLWKKPCYVLERKIYPQDKKIVIDFILEKYQIIRSEILIDLNYRKEIIRLSIAYKLHYGNPDIVEQYLLLSFLYICPPELELCNQYGLYTKEDIEKMENEKSVGKVYQYKQEFNLLKENQFYVFNMNRIEEPCADAALKKMLEKVQKMVVEWKQ